MSRRVQVIGATVWRQGQCIGVCGIGDGERGIVAYATCDVPPGVGARAGGRLKRVASKLARSKALKRIAKAALDKATRLPAAQAGGALTLARAALDASKRLEREARTDNGPDDANDDPADEMNAEEYELQ